MTGEEESEPNYLGAIILLVVLIFVAYMFYRAGLIWNRLISDFTEESHWFKREK